MNRVGLLKSAFALAGTSGLVAALGYEDRIGTNAFLGIATPLPIKKPALVIDGVAFLANSLGALGRYALLNPVAVLILFATLALVLVGLWMARRRRLSKSAEMKSALLALLACVFSMVAVWQYALPTLWFNNVLTQWAADVDVSAATVGLHEVIHDRATTVWRDIVCSRIPHQKYAAVDCTCSASDEFGFLRRRFGRYFWEFILGILAFGLAIGGWLSGPNFTWKTITARQGAILALSVIALLFATGAVLVLPYSFAKLAKQTTYAHGAFTFANGDGPYDAYLLAESDGQSIYFLSTPSKFTPTISNGSFANPAQADVLEDHLRRSLDLPPITLTSRQMGGH